MALSIGTDLVDASRMARAVERNGLLFIERFCSEYEISYIARMPSIYSIELEQISSSLESSYESDNVSQKFHDIKHWNVLSLSGIYAAKEAFAKAMGTGIAKGVNLHEIEVRHTELGAPFYELSGSTLEVFKSKGFSKAHLSISHDAGMAVAFCVCE